MPTPLPYYLDDETRKEAKLAAQWPKEHKCRLVGGRATYLSEEDWRGLQAYCETTDEVASYDWRHCRCGSTLMVKTAIHDLEAE